MEHEKEENEKSPERISFERRTQSLLNVKGKYNSLLVKKEGESRFHGIKIGLRGLQPVISTQNKVSRSKSEKTINMGKIGYNSFCVQLLIDYRGRNIARNRKECSKNQHCRSSSPNYSNKSGLLLLLSPFISR